MKLTQVTNRLGALVNKLTAGTATEEEKAEAKKLQAALEAAAKATEAPPKITMTLAEFQKLAEAEMAELGKAMDADRLALLKRNIAAVKLQGKTAPDDVVEIETKAEVPIVEDLEARAAALEAKASFDGRTTSGVRETPVEAPVKDKDPPAEEEFDKASVSQQLAVEALDALTGKVASLRVAVQAGTMTHSQYNDMFDGWWTLQDAVRTFAAISTSVTPESKAEPTKADPGTPEPAEKGDPWATPLSPRIAVEDAYRATKKNRDRYMGKERVTR